MERREFHRDALTALPDLLQLGHDLGDRCGAGAEREVDARGPQRLGAAPRGLAPGTGAPLPGPYERPYAGETRKETAAGRVLAPRIVGIDPHEVARAHLSRLETLAEREDVAHA